MDEVDEKSNSLEEVDLNEWLKYFDCKDKRWSISKRYVDPHRSSRLVQRFNQIGENHPLWTEHLASGLPTFYGLLCVSEKSSKEEIQKAYDRKLKYSIHSKEIIEEAFNTLSDQKLKDEYDSVLQLFSRVSQVFNPKEKKDMIQKHDAWLFQEKTQAISIYMTNKHKGWWNIFFRGAPTFYDLLGVKQTASIEQIAPAYEGKESSEIIEEAYKVLADDKLKEDYDFMLNFYKDGLEESFLNWISKKRGFWESLEESEGLMLALLKDTDRIEKAEEIMDMKSEWKNHLPPNETFYGILGMEMDGLPENDEEAEKALMDKFLSLEGSTEVKLAFDTLRDVEMRKKYDWAIKNCDLIIKLSELEDY